MLSYLIVAILTFFGLATPAHFTSTPQIALKPQTVSAQTIVLRREATETPPIIVSTTSATKRDAPKIAASAGRHPRTIIHAGAASRAPSTVPTPSPASSTPAPAPIPVPATPSIVTAAPPSIAPTNDFATQIQQDVMRLTNEERSQHGLSILASDARLTSVAREHSIDMITNNYFQHVDRGGCDPGCRITNGGYIWQTYGENIHWMSGYSLSVEGTAQKIVTDWMNSPEHRANILNGAFTQAGVGIAVDGSTVYSTADYGTPR